MKESYHLHHLHDLSTQRYHLAKKQNTHNKAFSVDEAHSEQRIYLQENRPTVWKRFTPLVITLNNLAGVLRTQRHAKIQSLISCKTHKSSLKRVAKHCISLCNNLPEISRHRLGDSPSNAGTHC